MKEHTDSKSLLTSILWLKWHLFFGWVKREKRWCIQKILTSYDSMNFLDVKKTASQKGFVFSSFSFVFFVWVFLGLFRGISTPNILQALQLYTYPNKLVCLYFCDLALGLLNLWLLGIYSFLSFIFFIYRPIGHSFYTMIFAAVIFLFVVTSHIFIYTMSLMFYSANRLMKKMIKGGVIFVSFSSVVYMIFGYNIDMIVSMGSNFDHVVWNMTPPGLISNILCDLYENRVDFGSIIGFVIYISICGYLSYSLLVRFIYVEPVLERDVVSFNTTHFEKISCIFETIFGDQIGGIIARELLYTIRSKRLSLIFVPVLVWGIMVSLFHIMEKEPFGFYSLLLMTPIVLMPYVVHYNAFGLEDRGSVFNFIAPVSPQNIILGKNIAYTFVQWLIIIPCMAGAFYLSWNHTTWIDILSITSIFYI